MSLDTDASPLQLWPALSPATEAALRESIERWGVLVPVARDQHGRTIDGHHRARIADELGCDYAVIVHKVEDDDEARELARTLNADRRHLTVEQRRDMVAHLREQGHSYRAIGEALGVSHEQARKDSAGVNNLTPETVTGQDGKRYPATKPKPPTIARNQREAERIQDALLSGREDPLPDGKKLAPLMSSDSPEWYTPSHIIECVVSVLGAIDVDPCSPGPEASPVPAATHYTEVDNGLSRPWRGRVYMNPPYGRGIGEWTDRLRLDYEGGDVSEAIALVPARTDTRWMAELREYPRCYIRGRLAFSGAETAAPFPSCAVYLGDRPEVFAQVFGKVGDVFALWGK